jgi:SAM-dependent methyltransferase
VRGVHGLIFDEAPTLYDRYRPSYPDEAVDHAVAAAGLAQGAHVLEVGAGTGQLTLPLLERGLVVTALEPAPRMAAMLRAKLRPFPTAMVVERTFESADLPAHAFDAVASATAFHWLDERERFRLVARALRSTGSLVLMRNDHVFSDGDAAYYAGAEAIYARLAPEHGPPYKPPVEADLPMPCSSVPEDAGFEVVDAYRLAWDQPYSTTQLIGLLRTYSNHRAMPSRRRAALLGSIRAFVDGELGGGFVDRYVTSVCVARPR